MTSVRCATADVPVHHFLVVVIRLKAALGPLEQPYLFRLTPVTNTEHWTRPHLLPAFPRHALHRPDVTLGDSRDAPQNATVHKSVSSSPASLSLRPPHTPMLGIAEPVLIIFD